MLAAWKAGLKSGERALTTEAAEGRRPFTLCLKGSSKCNSTGGVGGAVGVASEARGVVEASDPSLEKNGLKDPDPVLLGSVRKKYFELIFMKMGLVSQMKTINQNSSFTSMAQFLNFGPFLCHFPFFLKNDNFQMEKNVLF